MFSSIKGSEQRDSLEGEAKKIDLVLNQDETSNTNNISINNNNIIETKTKKGDNDIIKGDNFQNNGHYLYNNKEECPMEIEELTKEEEKKEQNGKII